MPSHRADTPADAPTLLAPRPSTRPAPQRRRDLRTTARATGARPHTPSAGLAWLEAAEQPRPVPRQAAPLSRRDVHRRPSLSQPAAGRPAASTALLDRESGELSSFGALALDPLFVPRQQPAPASPARGIEAPPWLPPVVPAAATPEPEGDPSADPETPTTGRAPRSAPTPGRRNGFSLPQAGIAGALGLATIAVPLTGAFAVTPPVKPAANTVSAAALAPLPPFPLATVPARTALDDVRLLPDEEPTAGVPAKLAAPRTLLVDRASRSNERAVLPGCDGTIPDASAVRNGQLPASMLCTLWDPRRQLRSDAAVAIAKLNLAYQQHFGHPMCFNDAYRSLAQQYRIKAERGSFAARPGTSEHGWGLAVDLCDGVDLGSSSLTYQWMRANGPLYGWENPAWALPGGAGPFEPWHWEYVPGEKGQSSGD